MRKLCVTAALTSILATPAFAGTGLLPDLQSVVPTKVQFVHQGQEDELRFTIGIANTGAGKFQVVAAAPLVQTQTQDAIQQILDSSGNIAQTKVVSTFAYHPEHKHFHITGATQYRVRSGSPTGPVVAGMDKTSFCLIDSYKLNDNSPTSQRTYWDCFGQAQGLDQGWVDQYNQALEGQSIIMTSTPPGTYYLTNTVNATTAMLESNYGNNTAWVAFKLERDAAKHGTITIVDHSPCSGGLCGPTTNR